MMNGAVLVSVGHAPGTSRAAARAAIRQALCTSVETTLGLTQVSVDASPGTRPRLLVAGLASSLGISISHTESHAFAAWHASENIGLDVMEVVDIPDWQALARDYLGPLALHRVASSTPEARAVAFCREWTAREASLKCLGVGISEWAELPHACMLTALTLPPGCVGTVAMLAPEQAQCR